ncbi:hypothetical protein [Leptolyngbya sp. FACHB-261]|uniref:hypothetical protein n=1 Tax=Leptolyngbya sp. FACHB-261 TaxID=2692806 RepID=UPI001687C96E|nr:hypothetical protein [Leptolyngbya sp. FACHB-261]MBD2099454.1 hypothetical protein [Leptolyngbya sp. FACHB-261]
MTLSPLQVATLFEFLNRFASYENLQPGGGPPGTLSFVLALADLDVELVVYVGDDFRYQLFRDEAEIFEPQPIESLDHLFDLYQKLAALAVDEGADIGQVDALLAEERERSKTPA